MIHSGRIANRAVLPHCKLWMWDREIHCGLEGFSFSPFGFCFRSHILIQWGRLKGGWLVALGLFHLLSLKSKQTLISGLSSTFSFFIKTGHVWKACLCSVAAPPDGDRTLYITPPSTWHGRSQVLLNAAVLQVMAGSSLSLHHCCNLAFHLGGVFQVFTLFLYCLFSLQMSRLQFVENDSNEGIIQETEKSSLIYKVHCLTSRKIHQLHWPITQWADSKSSNLLLFIYRLWTNGGQKERK